MNRPKIGYKDRKPGYFIGDLGYQFSQYLLTGASDPDGETSFTITSFTVGSVTTMVPGSYLIPNTDPQFAGTNIGTITINANGSYSFSAANISNYYKYSNYGPVPPISFTVADAQGETASHPATYSNAIQRRTGEDFQLIHYD